MGASEWMSRKMREKFGGGLDAIKRGEKVEKKDREEKQAYEFMPVPADDVFMKFASATEAEYRRRLEYMFAQPGGQQRMELPDFRDITSRDVSACEMSHDAVRNSFRFKLTIRGVEPKIGVEIDRETMSRIEQIAMSRSRGATYESTHDFNMAILDVLLAIVSGKQNKGGVSTRLHHEFSMVIGSKSRCVACGLDFASATQEQLDWCAETDAFGSVARWNCKAASEDCDDEPDADDPSAWEIDDEEEDIDEDEGDREREQERDEEHVVEHVKCEECGGCGWTPTSERDAQGFPKEVKCYLCGGKGIREIRKPKRSIARAVILTCPTCGGRGCRYCAFTGRV